jgi:hypothetical protein
MKATIQDRDRLEQETARLVERLKAIGAKRIILSGLLACGEFVLHRSFRDDSVPTKHPWSPPGPRAFRWPRNWHNC